MHNNIPDFNDLGIESYISYLAESECRPPEFSKSLFFKIWNKELEYIMLVSMKCGLDLRQKQNRLFVGRLFVWGIISKNNYVEKNKYLNE